MKNTWFITAFIVICVLTIACSTSKKSITVEQKICGPTGVCFAYNHDTLDIFYKVNNLKDGPIYRYYNNQLKISGNYKNDKKDGEWFFYSLDGRVGAKFYYKDGVMIRKIINNLDW